MKREKKKVAPPGSASHISIFKEVFVITNIVAEKVGGHCSHTVGNDHVP